MRFLSVCVIILVVANFLIYRAIFAPHVFTTSALDVGKGTATLVQTPDRKIILIDTGPDASILRALGQVLSPWQRTIDLVILTSNKKSSTGGLSDVLSRYKVLQQITLTQSQHIAIGTTSISISDGKTLTKIR